MTIHEERFLDASERDASGSYEYYYSGVLYRIQGERGAWTARAYDDEPSRVSFLGFRKTNSSGSTAADSPAEILTEVPYGDSTFREAVRTLLSKGHTEVFLLTTGGEGYVPVDLNRLDIGNTD